MNEVICVCVASYRNALTRGKRYAVLDTDAAKEQLRVKGDNGRARWFSELCFVPGDQLVPLLVGYKLDDPITPGPDQNVEVMVQLSDGQRRWCTFVTPSQLANHGEWIEGTQIPFHYENHCVIIAGQLSEELIGRMLQQIEDQGELVNCTWPLRKRDDEPETTQAVL